MKRRIVQQGPTTLMTSLPIKWVRRFNLSKGEELDIQEQGNKLIISTEKQEKGAKTEIDLKSTNRSHIWRILQPLYALGYDEIKVNFDSNKTLDIIQEFIISSLIGFEITDQGKTYCVIKSVSTGLNEQFDSILRKVFLNLVYSSEITMTYLEKGESMDQAINLELMNNRHTMFLKRILIKDGYEDSRKTSFVYLLVNYLEKIQNEFQYLALHVKEKNMDNLKGLNAVYRRIHEQLRGGYEMFYSYDAKKAEELITKGINPIEFKKISAKDQEALHYLWEITKISRSILHQVISIRGIR